MAVDIRCLKLSARFANKIIDFMDTDMYLNVAFVTSKDK